MYKQVENDLMREAEADWDEIDKLKVRRGYQHWENQW